MSDVSHQPPTEEELLGPDELRAHFSEYFSRAVGTDDLEEGNRRLAVLQSWRTETEPGGVDR